MVETLYITNRGQITIPAKIRDSMNLKVGDRVVLVKINKGLVIYNAYESDKDIMKLYKSIKPPKGKSTNPDVALTKAKKLKAVEYASWSIYWHERVFKIPYFRQVQIIAEAVYVLEKYYELSKNEVQQKLIPILVHDNLIIDGKEKMLASLTIFYEKNVDFEDSYTYFDMLNSHILKIITFDEKHFKRFDDIEILSIV